MDTFVSSRHVSTLNQCIWEWTWSTSLNKIALFPDFWRNIFSSQLQVLKQTKRIITNKLDQEKVIIIADFVSTKTPGTKVLEWPPTIHVIFILTASLVCKPGFFQVGSRCFHVNNTDKVTWAESLNRCKRIGGILATVDNEFLTSATLTHNLTLPGDLHIGLFTTENWEWQDGTSLNTGFWHPGYPQNITGWPTCAALSNVSLSLWSRWHCTFLAFSCPLSFEFCLCSCQTFIRQSMRQFFFTVNVVYGQPTSQSSILNKYDSFLAVDDSYTTCFRSRQVSESKPR